MSTERANDRLITVHAPFLAIAPNQNVRKQNIVWEFAKMFETMLAVQLWRAINAHCVTRVGTVFFGKIPWRISSLVSLAR